MTYSPNGSMVEPTEQNKIAPAKALHKLITEERSGRLTLVDPNDPSIQWCAYFGGGQIHFAGSLMGHRERLTYLLSKASPGLEAGLNFDANSDYQMVCQYWRSQQMPLNWVRNILASITQEGLINFLAIPQGYVKYDPSIGLDPLLLSVPFRQLVLPVRDAITQWTQLRTALNSPFQRPYFKDYDRCLQMVWRDSKLCQQFQEVSPFIDKKLTLYEIAYRSSIDVLELAILLHPLIAGDAMGIEPHQVLETPKRSIVACIDDSPTIQQFVKLSLESSGYEVLSIMDPTEAITILLAQQPKMILMDIEMPKIDGYELCRMARQFEVLRHIPIVMLTGREGIIDRVRARMAGCTAYLTKPFNPQELLDLVQKLTQSEPVPQI